MKNALLIGDTHCGSYWGLWPRHLLPRSSRFSGVEYLLACYDHMLAWCPKKLDLLILMGDLIDGRQGKSEGTGLFTASLGEQADAAIEILTPLADRAKRILRLDCTPYHGGFHQALSALDERFGIVPGDQAQVIDLEIGGRILNVAHHPGGGGILYRGTGVDKQAVWSRVAAGEGLINMPTWIASAHSHFYAQQDDGSTVVLQTPPFQLSTPHALKLQRWRYRSKVGAVLMTRDRNHWSGYRFIAQLYDPPLLTPIKVDTHETGAQANASAR